ncbi:hypothetical protein AVEN_3184-1 [Araneus ventricosus]|uniref:RNase H type-1 domain-containing protein n=1 Tax=Araneus ventricosus TaxID=182803 RepID=A0A4Y2TYI1_ARAVE|nr:hypothetical protein AVEN_3184-1 [Araneus ventricosus]
MKRSPLFSITKAYSTTSTDALHVPSGCPPLDLKNRVGCAFVHFQENDESSSELFRLSGKATVLMAELMAIRQAVKYIIRRQPRQAKIIESRPAFLSFASLPERRQIINEIKDNIRERASERVLFMAQGPGLAKIT